jgi:hypothetical protein
MRPLPREGGVWKSQKSKVEKSKIAKSQKSNWRFLDFAEKERKAKNPRDRASRFYACARTPGKTFDWQNLNTALDCIKLALDLDHSES